LDHFVTQWISVRNCSLGSARNFSHDHEAGSSTAPVIENVHVSRTRRASVRRTTREIVHDVLAGRDPARVDVPSPSAAEPTRISGLIRSHLADDVRAVDGRRNRPDRAS
jgi:hypothetical protein